MIVAEQQSGDLERGPGARVDQSGQYREHRRIERVGAGCHPARRLATDAMRLVFKAQGGLVTRCRLPTCPTGRQHNLAITRSTRPGRRAAPAAHRTQR